MKRDIPRGHFVETVRSVDGVDLGALVWKDNKLVTMLSSYTESLPVGTINR